MKFCNLESLWWKAMLFQAPRKSFLATLYYFPFSSYFLPQYPLHHRYFYQIPIYKIYNIVFIFYFFIILLPMHLTLINISCTISYVSVNLSISSSCKTIANACNACRRYSTFSFLLSLCSVATIVSNNAASAFKASL